MLNPVANIVVVKPEGVGGNVHLREAFARENFRGRVLAAGPRATEVVRGDIVHLTPSRAIEAVFDGARVWITREPEILCIEGRE